MLCGNRGKEGDRPLFPKLSCDAPMRLIWPGKEGGGLENLTSSTNEMREGTAGLAQNFAGLPSAGSQAGAAAGVLQFKSTRALPRQGVESGEAAS